MIPEQEFVEQGAADVIEHDQFAIEHNAWGQEIEYLLVALNAVAVARDQLATNGVGGGAEAVEFGLEDPVGMVERLWPPDRIDQ